MKKIPPAPEALPHLELLTAPHWRDYELLDSGNGQKLERYGPYIFIRPEPQAVWRPRLHESRWREAHALFHATQEESGGHWEFNKPIESSWIMQYRQIKFRAQTTAGRHIGVFPEQAAHWDWMEAKIRSAARPIHVLNLFGYTGLASLVAAQAGAKVTHVDASKKAILWARDNQALSNLNDRPIRWIVDDALKFVLREGRRGGRYDGLILDPPKFGRGPKGEVWEFFKLMPALLQACRQILSEKPLFVILTAYAIRASALSLHYSLQETLAGYEGMLSSGELALVEHSGGRVISTAIFARWCSKD